ncbi:Mismatch repair protein Msh6 [Carpediemonas membranifera]|uniref:DNA mismatch repair protein n=1 Tax=Carpediemonas membranifera TaxID=201153 RepID=A0A8J6AU99_9EUKA|nr:Mismatch repair protein Msh6 [Carpediemonas membranifera]|eukprot:KAG9394333.1 Mismatch repair protein Msh6 [Carpediemonas membranifera]
MAPKQKTKVQATLLSFFGAGAQQTSKATMQPAPTPKAVKTKAPQRTPKATPAKRARKADKPVVQEKPVKAKQPQASVALDDDLLSDFEDEAPTSQPAAVSNNDSSDEEFVVDADEPLEDLDAVLATLSSQPVDRDRPKVDVSPAVSPMPQRGKARTMLDDDEEEDDDEPSQPEETDAVLAGFSPTSPRKARAARRPTVSTGKADKEAATRFPFLVHRKDAKGRRPGDPGFDSNTLLITPDQMASMTNFEQQFWAVKRDHMDTVILFKKGKFYEMFEGDADVGHRELDLRITERVNMRMTGVPESGWERWAAKLLARGYRVGRVEQVETAAQASKGKSKIIKRELIEVLTSGTVVDPDMVPSRSTTFLLALAPDPADTATAPAYGFVLMNASSGLFHMGRVADTPQLDGLRTLLHHSDPREVLVDPTLNSAVIAHMRRRLGRLCSTQTAEDAIAAMNGHPRFAEAEAADAPRQYVPAVVTQYPAATGALGMVYAYLRELKLLDELVANGAWTAYELTTQSGTLQLDVSTLENLAVLTNDDGGSAGTLLEYVDRAKTAMGHRRLRDWVCRPLRGLAEIQERQEVVRAFMEDFGVLQTTVGTLDRVPDVERLVSRALSGKLPLGHFLRLLRAVETCREVRAALESLAGTAIVGEFVAADHWASVDDMLAFFYGAFDVAQAAEGKFIVNDGFHANHDKTRALIAKLESELEDRLADIQVDLPHAKFEHLQAERYQVVVRPDDAVPNDWRLMSRTKAKARYWPADVAPLVRDHAAATDDLKAIQGGLLADVQRDVSRWRGALNGLLDGIATIDILAAFASVALSSTQSVCLPTLLPEVTEPGAASFTATGLTHPSASRASGFIPNDVAIGGAAPSLLLLTGPNLGGKSTLLRQVSLAVILGQIGACVPAAACEFTIADAVLTRCGARDLILSGQSTLHVELSEAARILNTATPNSLAILDELGRGASSTDGHALGFAAVTAIAESGNRAIFATHDHSLVRDVRDSDRIEAYYMACEVPEGSDDIKFFYKLTKGSLNSSFGPNVAKLAGVAQTIVEHAQQLAADRERLEAGTALIAALEHGAGEAFVQTRAAEWVRLMG